MKPQGEVVWFEGVDITGESQLIKTRIVLNGLSAQERIAKVNKASMYWAQACNFAQIYLIA